MSNAPPAAPRVSIVIVNWNSLEYLPGCFGSIEHQTLDSIEVVVVDNGSTDGSLAWIRENYPRTTIIENGRNTGFCVANNQGIAASRGEFVLLMNTDVVLDADFLEVVFSRSLGTSSLLSVADRRLERAEIHFTGTIVSLRYFGARL